jgi:hypothetical protein
MKTLAAGSAWLSYSSATLPPRPRISSAGSGLLAACYKAFGTVTKTELSIEGRIYFLKENTTKLPDFSKEKSQGSVFADQFDVPPQDFTAGFPGVTSRFEWFRDRLSGIDLRAGRRRVRVQALSDDGSKLYIDGKVVIDMDKVQGMGFGRRQGQPDAGRSPVQAELLPGSGHAAWTALACHAARIGFRTRLPSVGLQQGHG